MTPSIRFGSAGASYKFVRVLLSTAIFKTSGRSAFMEGEVSALKIAIFLPGVLVASFDNLIIELSNSSGIRANLPALGRYPGQNLRSLLRPLRKDIKGAQMNNVNSFLHLRSFSTRLPMSESA